VSPSQKNGSPFSCCRNLLFGDTITFPLSHGFAGPEFCGALLHPSANSRNKKNAFFIRFSSFTLKQCKNCSILILPPSALRTERKTFVLKTRKEDLFFIASFYQRSSLVLAVINFALNFCDTAKRIWLIISDLFMSLNIAELLML
jgi:hypothetical protein